MVFRGAGIMGVVSEWLKAMGSGDVVVSAWSGRLMSPPSEGENQWSPGGISVFVRTQRCSWGCSPTVLSRVVSCQSRSSGSVGLGVDSVYVRVSFRSANSCGLGAFGIENRSDISAKCDANVNRSRSRLSPRNAFTVSTWLMVCRSDRPSET